MNNLEQSEVISFDKTPCDIIGELQGKHMHDITDHILFSLDWESLKNVGQVSKRWREAMMVALGTIVRKGNPNWTAQELSSWQRIHSHLKNDFKVSIQDPRYALCLSNSINFISKNLQTGEFWAQPEMTLDYLPFLRSDDEDSRVEHLCRMEMSDNFIVAWESSTRLFKCWSRRTLSPISMDQEFQKRNFPSISLNDVNKQFNLFGNYLYYAQSSTCPMRDNFAKVTLTRTDLDLRGRGIEEEEFKASFYVEPPTEKAILKMVCLDAVDDMILLNFSVCVDGRRVGNALTVQRNVERLEARDILKSDLLQVPPVDRFQMSDGDVVFDKDYLLVQSHMNYFRDTAIYRTYSLHPPKDGGGTMELRSIATLELENYTSFDYRDGLLVYATLDGEINFVDVSNGSLLEHFQSPMDGSRDGIIISLGKGVVIGSEEIYDESSASPMGDDDEYPLDAKGRTFYVWDTRSILNQPTRKMKPTPICTFTTLTGNVESLFVDDFGIAAVMEKDSTIQVLNLLPACNHCKRLTKPALLKRCSRCKSVTYCSKECQAADWIPHHKAICSKVIPLAFS